MAAGDGVGMLKESRVAAALGGTLRVDLSSLALTIATSEPSLPAYSLFPDQSDTFAPREHLNFLLGTNSLGLFILPRIRGAEVSIFFLISQISLPTYSACIYTWRNGKSF